MCGSPPARGARLPLVAAALVAGAPHWLSSPSPQLLSARCSGASASGLGLGRLINADPRLLAGAVATAQELPDHPVYESTSCP